MAWHLVWCQLSCLKAWRPPAAHRCSALLAAMHGAISWLTTLHPCTPPHPPSLPPSPPDTPSLHPCPSCLVSSRPRLLTSTLPPFFPRPRLLTLPALLPPFPRPTDNVGDNVGDIAGMGADLFGSFAESTCAALVVTSVSSLGANHLWVSMCYPLLISGEAPAGIFVVCGQAVVYAATRRHRMNRNRPRAPTARNHLPTPSDTSPPTPHPSLPGQAPALWCAS